MKKWLIAIGLIVAALLGWYVFSIATRVIEVQEASPLAVKDAMDTMDDATKAEFEKQVKAMEGVILTMDDSMPVSPSLLAQGPFKARAHSVEGTAKLIAVGDKKVLRFEDFNTLNGPNLHIYLASDLSADDIIDLGKIKATKGNVNYDIAQGIDTNKYNKVLVWCVPFGVLFSYAELTNV